LTAPVGMLLGYTADGEVVATLDYVVLHDEATGEVIGLVDFLAHEQAGREHADIIRWSEATGAKAWPEWLARAHEYRVELEGPPGKKRIKALVHRKSGKRRERKSIDAAIKRRVDEASGGQADLRSIVGGPDRPLVGD